MAETDHNFFAADAFADVGLGFVGVAVAFLDVVSHFIRAAVFGAFECADSAGDGGIHIGAGAGNHARGEGGGVEFMLCIKNQRNVHGFYMFGARALAVQKVQEMAADAVFFAVEGNHFAVVRILIPVKQHAAQRSHQFVGDVARFAHGVGFALGRSAAQGRHAGAHHVHRVGVGRQAFEHGKHVGGQVAQRLQLFLIGSQLEFVGQMAVHQQVRHFFEFAMFGQIENVVAAVAQVVTVFAHGAQGGVAGGDAGKRHGFFRLGGNGGVCFGHGFLLSRLAFFIFQTA